MIHALSNTMFNIHDTYTVLYTMFNIHDICIVLYTMFRASFSVCCMIFQKISNKSHNMKAMIILSHSWPPFLLLSYSYGENELLWDPVHTFLSIFTRKNSPNFKRTHLYWHTFTKLSLSNIMKHGESDVEWQISIQGIHFSAFWNIFGKEEPLILMIYALFYTECLIFVIFVLVCTWTCLSGSDHCSQEDSIFVSPIQYKHTSPLSMGILTSTRCRLATEPS